MVDTASGQHELPFAEKFKIFCFVFNREGKMQEASEERVQNVNRRDGHIFKSEDVPWREK